MEVFRTEVITFNDIITKVIKYFKDNLESNLAEAKMLKFLIDTDDKCWHGVEGVDGRWSALPNNRTLDEHWRDYDRLNKALKNVEFYSKMDLADNYKLINYAGNIGYDLGIDNNVCSNGHTIDLDQKVLYLEVNDYDGYAHQGIVLCKKCVTKLSGML